MLTPTRFSGFDYHPSQISKFLAVLDFFTILLKDGNIVHFTPSCAHSFRKWLLDHKVTDIGVSSRLTDGE